MKQYEGIVVSVVPQLKSPCVHPPGAQTYDWRRAPGTPHNTRGTRAVATVMPLNRALTDAFATDEHALMYTLYRADGAVVSPHPRIGRDALTWLRDHGFHVRCRVMLADLDGGAVANEDAWTQVHAHALDPASPFFETTWYKTRRGGRLVRPLVVAEHPVAFEATLASWYDQLEDAGVVADRACQSWNHIFRLPGARRDGSTR